MKSFEELVDGSEMQDLLSEYDEHCEVSRSLRQEADVAWAEARKVEDKLVATFLATNPDYADCQTFMEHFNYSGGDAMMKVYYRAQDLLYNGQWNPGRRIYELRPGYVQIMLYQDDTGEELETLVKSFKDYVIPAFGPALHVSIFESSLSENGSYYADLNSDGSSVLYIRRWGSDQILGDFDDLFSLFKEISQKYYYAETLRNRR